MNDEFRMTLNSPFTKDDWDKITDVNMEHTKAVTFQTEGGKKAEFVKVVLCKDCKYFRWNKDSERYGKCLINGPTWPPDGFCSDAERAEK